MTLRWFFSGLWRGLDGLRRALHLILLLLIFGVLLGVLRGSVPKIPAKAALLLVPEGQLVEQLSGDPLERALQETRGETHRETLLWDLTDSIHAAATDARIGAVALDLEKFEGGTQPTLEELAVALREFRASGKKVIAYGAEMTQERYYLAAQADEVLLDPMGLVLIDGYDRYRMYLKDALDKLGVAINVFRVGSFKSAVETFTRTNMSPEDREESRTYLSALWSSYQAAVTRARKLGPDALEKYVDSLAKTVSAAGGDTARVALQANLVSGLKTRIEFEQRLIGLVGKDDDNGSFKSISADDYVRYARAQKKLKADGKPRVGVIVAQGDILDGDQPPGSIGGDTVARLIRQARNDKDIKALVLRVDSPGGSVMASEQIYRELVALRSAGKPVVVSMSGYAASGGYYISAPADEIWASPATITGSIGIFAIIPTIERTLGKVGVGVDGVGTTPLSGQLRLDRAQEVPRPGRCHRAGAGVGRHRCAAHRPRRSARLLQRCHAGRGPPRQGDGLRARIHRARAHLGTGARHAAQVEPRGALPARKSHRGGARAAGAASRPGDPRGAAPRAVHRAEPPVRLLLLPGPLVGEVPPGSGRCGGAAQNASQVYTKKALLSLAERPKP